MAIALYASPLITLALFLAWSKKRFLKTPAAVIVLIPMADHGRLRACPLRVNSNSGQLLDSVDNARKKWGQIYFPRKGDGFILETKDERNE